MDNHTYHEETHEESGITLKIKLDDAGGTESPLEYDEAVTVCIFSRRYFNPAKGKQIAKPFGNGSWDMDDQDDVQAFHKANAHAPAPYAVFLLYAYEHGRVIFQPSRGGNPFSCQWDSGCAGIIALKKSEVGTPGAKVKNGKGEVVHVIGDYFKQAEQVCENYTAWINGDVFGYVIENAEGEHLDSCWGYIEADGPEGYVLEEARRALESAVEDWREEQAKEAAATAARAKEFGMESTI